MKIVAFSDTHMHHRNLSMPDGDMLIFAGDMCKVGRLDEIDDFNDYLSSLPHPHKIVIAGNHDWAFAREPQAARQLLNAAIYLQDSAVEIAGMKIHGSPWQPAFSDWAFNLPRGEALRQKWELIPDDCDILVTHGPPLQMLDRIINGTEVGCEMLKEAVERIRPKLHVFGHIHEDYGICQKNGIIYANASILDHYNQVYNSPLVIELGSRSGH